MATKNFNNVSATPVFFFAQLVAVAVATLVLVWLLHFREGIDYNSPSKPKIFNVHPLLMVIGFFLTMGEAIMAYKIIPGKRERAKAIHLVLHFIALVLGIVGICAVFKFHDEVHIPHMYTLHSWIGLSTIILFGIQTANRVLVILFRTFGPIVTVAIFNLKYKINFSRKWLVSFVSFFWPGAKAGTRDKLAPWHVFLGIVIFLMATITAELGLVEKFIFLGLKRNQEALVINFTGLLIFLFAVAVAFSTLLRKTRN